MHACMHACLHTYIHAYIHTHIHTHIHTYIHTYTHTVPNSSCNASCIHILKSQHTVTFYSKYSRALTFENVCLVLSGSMSLCTCRHRVRAQSSCQLAQTSRCAQGRLHVPARVLPHVCSRRRHARQETHTVSGSAAATNLTELRVWGKKGTNCSRG